MANTYSQIYVQVVFAVQGRENLIKSEWRDELYKYITGIVKNHEQKLIIIGGISNHIHILLGIKPNIALSDLVREIKANSSRFVNERKFVKGKFYWQEGFGAFSYSHSQLDAVIRYIENQEEHHTQKSFKDEYRGFLKNFRVEHDEKYLFEWLE
ncbi:MAG: IS200/IS605 family transposase [Acidobacteria bacterium]|nr:IS200/IS605 family transposase [Acidobacteriota bacterium]